MRLPAVYRRNLVGVSVSELELLHQQDGVAQLLIAVVAGKRGEQAELSPETIEALRSLDYVR